MEALACAIRLRLRIYNCAPYVWHNFCDSFTQKSGSVAYRPRTNDSDVSVPVPPGLLLSNNPGQVIYTHGAQANSAFHPPAVGK